ncbi:MAG: organoarsenical effux MFS transporter ArsJ [Chromatiaceae bacterium]|nr:organoarsenical effux MFS transporter ArsJ [Chromatiaceae bacterium]MCF7995927.1 organoarsenical effux MFS transporter ArsJ [Chromatiaceae bacterium]
MDKNTRNYLTVTAGYWAFTITDGAIRMLVVLYFHQLGYSPFEVAMLFLFYEVFGIITNLVGGWLGSRIGLNLTMHIGMGLQVIALMMLTVPDAWLGVVYVMAAQALSGIAKDLNKMSAKATVKTLTGDGPAGESKLFKYVAVLTGSKNALKGAGFFVGAALLQGFGFRNALFILAGGLFLVMVITIALLPSGVGKLKEKAKFTQVFSNTPAINWLSAARFFLFGARDVWFVVALPVYLYSVLNWEYTAVGAFLALWVIGYGFVQAGAPALIRPNKQGHGPSGRTALLGALLLAVVPAGIALALSEGPALAWEPAPILIVGLILFGIVFAINSAVHSYLILAYADADKVALNVGFYYMANAGGRLAGTVLSGLIYQIQGLEGCLWWSTGFVLAAALLSLWLPRTPQATALKAVAPQPGQVQVDGVVEPTRRAELYAPMAGRLQACSVREGDPVHAGQRLLSIVPTADELAEHPIEAPWDGRIARLHARVEGREIAAQTLLVELFDPDSLVLRFAVDGQQAIGLGVGQSVQVQFSAAPDSLIALRITRTWPALEPETDQRVFEAWIPPQADLAIGMKAQVRANPAISLQLPANSLDGLASPSSILAAHGSGPQAQA